MQFRGVLTRRKRESDPWFDIVHEWEDVVSSCLNLPLVHKLDWGWRALIHLRLIRLLRGRWKFRPMIYFQMRAWQGEAYNCSNLYPCLIDFFSRSDEELARFYSNFAYNPLVLISSREAYEFLLSKNCPLKIMHLALSLPDKYAIKADTKFEKKYDLVVMGRQSRCLMEYLQEYANKHPDFVWVKRIFLADETGGKHYAKYITSTGEELGYSDSREEYFNLMRASKICFYSTPGIDFDRADASAFNQVTPRFLEMIASGCHVIARYPKNPDTDWYKMDSIAPSVVSYAQFEYLMDYARSHDVDMAKYAEYLKNHYTSRRVKDLRKIMEDLP